MNKRKIWKWTKIILMLYGIIGIALFYLQDYFLFHPKPLPANHKFSIQGRFEEIFIPYSKTDTIHLLRFLPDSGKPKGAVLYFHGNKENVERYAGFAKSFTSKGYEVWMPDYPGFGKSTGVRDEKKLYSQAWQVYKLLANSFHADSILVYGKSFGTGIAAYIASGNRCRYLILETPYYSIPALFSHYAPIYPSGYMANYQLPLYKYLQDVKSPVAILHGTNDGVIPYAQAKKLAALLKPGDQFISIEGGTHHNLAGYAQYANLIKAVCP